MRTAHRMAEAYARYVVLIASQLEALDRDELETVGLLGAQREQLAVEIDALECEGTQHAVTDETLRQLAAGIDADTQLRERLERLRLESAAARRRVDRWRQALRTNSRVTSEAGAVAARV
jgi:hypothetical protein